MLGTISFIREKEGARGKYFTLALEDGTKGLVVNTKKLMDIVEEGETYNFTLEKSGIFTIVTGINEPGEGATAPVKKLQKPSVKPQAGSYQSEYMKKRTPKETEIIAKQAFAKSLIDAYARLWVEDKISFEGGDDFNEQVRGDTEQYINWLKIEE